VAAVTIAIDEDRLERRLAILSHAQVITFASTCAARLEKTAIELSSADTLASVTTVIEAISFYLSARIEFDSNSFEEELLQTMPDEDENPDFVSAVIEDAAAAGVYALRTVRDGSARDAVWAARRAYDTADRRVLQMLNVDEIGVSEEAYILQHPVVQAELQRQERDISALEALESDDRMAMETMIRRARNENILDV
jgi:hypothetical protein